MDYLGIVVHKKESQICILSEDGELLERRIRTENFPPGVYQLEMDTSAAPLNPRDWHFVVADHQCNTSDILGFPHEPQPARVVP